MKAVERFIVSGRACRAVLLADHLAEGLRRTRSAVPVQARTSHAAQHRGGLSFKHSAGLRVGYPPECINTVLQLYNSQHNDCVLHVFVYRPLSFAHLSFLVWNHPARFTRVTRRILPCGC